MSMHPNQGGHGRDHHATHRWLNRRTTRSPGDMPAAELLSGRVDDAFAGIQDVPSYQYSVLSPPVELKYNCPLTGEAGADGKF